MNARTLIGQLITPDGMARRAHWHQPEPELIGPLMYRSRPPVLRTDHFRIDRRKVKATQPDWIGMKVGHDDCVGQAKHLEQQPSGLWMIAEIYGPVPPEMTYLSPEWTQRGDDGDITIRGAGLVDEPAQILMSPVTILDGALTGCSTRGLKSWQAEMLERARAATKHRTRGEGIYVYDPAYDAWGGHDPASDPRTHRATGTRPSSSQRIHNVNRPDGLFIRPGRILSVR